MMSRRVMMTAFAVGVSAVLVAAGAGSASAAGSTDAVGGRERVKVTVSAEGENGELACEVRIDSTPFPIDYFIVRPGTTQTEIYSPISSGSHTINIYCGRTGAVLPLTKDHPVTVGTANPLLDTVDGVLAGVGSSALVTDPTKR